MITLLIILSVVYFLFLCLIYGLSQEEAGCSFGGLVGSVIYLGSLQWWLGVDIITYLRQNPWSILLLVVGYFLCGAIWSLFKWYKFCKSEYKRGIKAGVGVNEIGRYKPTPSSNKDRIFSWILFFPISVLFYVVGDVIRDVLDLIYNKLVKLYQSIADKVFGE